MSMPCLRPIHRHVLFAIGLTLLANPACQSVAWNWQSPATINIPDELLYQMHRSPSGRWELVLLAEAGWVYAPHVITVLHRDITADPQYSQVIIRFDLANDGANLRDDNCMVKWQISGEQEIALLTCNGQEQEPAVYVIDVASGTLLRSTDPNTQKP